jgi:hypothetical protein
MRSAPAFWPAPSRVPTARLCGQTYIYLSPRFPICLDKDDRTKIILDPTFGTVDSKSK